MDTIKEQLPQIMLQNMPLIKEFKSNAYKDAFDDLFRTYRPVFDHLEEVYLNAEDKGRCVKEIAEDFVEKAKRQYDERKTKTNKSTLTLDYNMLMASFVIPCILEYRGESTEALADALILAWNNTFTAYKIQKGRFSDIDGSFKRKLCYITTAVCDSLGKEDDCYELNMLRGFRDNYMMHSQEGIALVREYYEMAPLLVMRMNSIKDSGAIYQGIYDQFIQPCIAYIEERRYRQCQDKYREMVQTLRNRYIGGAHE